MLTSAAIKAARPKPRPYKLSDAGGLFLFVAPTGLRSFRMKFRFDGREQLLTIGRFPEISLADARAQRDAARALLERGENPCKAESTPDQPGVDPMLEATFEPIARAWYLSRRSRWSTAHAEDTIRSLELHVFPAIGAKRLDDIDAGAVLELLQAIEAAGAIETARRVRQRISMIFSYAIVRKKASQDPAAVLTRELAAAPIKRPQLALLELDEVRALYADIAAIEGTSIARLAVQLLALTAVRAGALRDADWDEFSDIDWDGNFIGPLRPSWTIPPARMKLTAAKKQDPANAHHVTLSRQAVDVLRELRALTGGAGRVFRGRGKNRPIGESALGEIHVRAGYAGRHVPHGWRASFSTIMNERHPSDRAAIDRALAHAPKNKVEAAYNRAEHLARRRWLFQAWADLLCAAAPRG
ncbi:tyrosine-type recombinase/integrase [soil metagenome]